MRNWCEFAQPTRDVHPTETQRPWPERFERRVKTRPLRHAKRQQLLQGATRILGLSAGLLWNTSRTSKHARKQFADEFDICADHCQWSVSIVSLDRDCALWSHRQSHRRVPRRDWRTHVIYGDRFAHRAVNAPPAHSLGPIDVLGPEASLATGAGSQGSMLIHDSLGKAACVICDRSALESRVTVQLNYCSRGREARTECRFPRPSD